MSKYVAPEFVVLNMESFLLTAITLEESSVSTSEVVPVTLLIC
jgi:hypothetical protein